MLYPDQDADYSLSNIAFSLGLTVLIFIAVILAIIIAFLFSRHPIAMSIGAASLAIIAVLIRIIYKRHKECLKDKNYIKVLLSNLNDTKEQPYDNVYYHLKNLYGHRRGKRRMQIEHALDSYFDTKFKVCFDNLNDNTDIFNVLNELNCLLHDYYSYKPAEARKVIVRRNDIMAGIIRKMVRESRPYENVLLVLFVIEHMYDDRFRHGEKDLYDKFASDIYGLLLPLTEKISAEISGGEEFSFPVALPENIVGLIVSRLLISLNSDGLKIGTDNKYIPYRNIPDFENETYEGFMPLVSDDMNCYIIKPDTIGGTILKHILTQQRERVSPSGPLPEVLSTIDEVFEERRKAEWEYERRKHEEEMDRLRQDFLISCN